MENEETENEQVKVQFNREPLIIWMVQPKILNLF